MILTSCLANLKQNSLHVKHYPFFLKRPQPTRLMATSSQVPKISHFVLLCLSISNSSYIKLLEFRERRLNSIFNDIE